MCQLCSEAHLYTHMHIHTTCLANFSWACSQGTESAQKDCAAAEKVEDNLFVTQL